MCTVVTQWEPDRPLQVLAVRDELLTRDFDGPGAWWPDHRGVIGGRDRRAGGSWCVSDVASGATALVLNRTERHTGSPSRGVLPLAAARHGDRWTDHVDHTAMATFTLVLAGPGGVVAWEWDALELRRLELPPGVHVATPWGVDAGDARHARLEPQVGTTPWKDLVTAAPPADDRSALVVRHELDGGEVYGTVFAQLIDAGPGRLRIEHSRTPWRADTWTTQEWASAGEDRIELLP